MCHGGTAARAVDCVAVCVKVSACYKFCPVVVFLVSGSGTRRCGVHVLNGVLVMY